MPQIYKDIYTKSHPPIASTRKKLKNFIENFVSYTHNLVSYAHNLVSYAHN
jgi:hypothetical protein